MLVAELAAGACVQAGQDWSNLGREALIIWHNAGASRIFRSGDWTPIYFQTR